MEENKESLKGKGKRMKYVEIAILTVIIGYMGDAILGNFLNWPSAGVICAIATVGAFLLREIDKK